MYKKFCLVENNENSENDEDNENNENKNYKIVEVDEKFNKYQKVKDHCHYTRKFRGAAHNISNLTYEVPKNIPIVIHNAGYDNRTNS